MAPTKKLTAAKLKFTGVITNEYRTQIKPVAAKARFCDTLSFSAGRLKSLTPAMTRHHFIIGAQKNTVFGPAGWFKNCWNFVAPAEVAAPDMAVMWAL